MNLHYPESAYNLTERLVWFARMCSKIRLMDKGLLPEDYHEFYGVGFDGRCCRFLKVSHEDVKRLIREGKNNEEALEWCYQNGYRPNDEEVLIWNAFMMKRGWQDDNSESVREEKEKSGFKDRDEIQTYFEFYEYDEKRKS
jgi:hypothetical protein